jgi:hypothetical protein
MVIKLIVDGLKTPSQIRKIHHPTLRLRYRSGYMNLDTERMAMQSSAFVTFGYIWQTVRRFYLEDSENIHR